MNEIRYGIFYNDQGKAVNLFKDGRSFKTKKWASTLKYRFRNHPTPLFIDEVPAPITDIDRINWLLENNATVIVGNSRESLDSDEGFFSAV